MPAPFRLVEKVIYALHQRFALWQKRYQVDRYVFRLLEGAL